MRNYVDPYHKPELLVAVERVRRAVRLPRPRRIGRATWRHSASPALAPGRRGAAHRRGRAAPARRGRDAARLARTGPGGARRPPWPAPGTRSPPGSPRSYPADLGVVVALLLNHVRLQPGEAVFMPAGNLHAYLSGAGVEIMAASDNVLRGGLTPKHVDLAELARVLRYEVLESRCTSRSCSAPACSAGRRPMSPSSLWSRPPSTRVSGVTLPGSRAADRALRARQRGGLHSADPVAAQQRGRRCSSRRASPRLRSAATRSCSRQRPNLPGAARSDRRSIPRWVADPTR